LVRNSLDFRTGLQAVQRDVVLNCVQENLRQQEDGEIAGRFSRIRTQIEALETENGSRVLLQAFSSQDEILPRAESNVPQTASPPDTILARAGSNPSTLGGGDSSPRRSRKTQNPQQNQTDDFSSVSFAGSSYSIDATLVDMLIEIFGYLPDELVAEQIRRLQVARHEAQGDDLAGSDQAAISFYYNFRQFLEDVDRQNLGRRRGRRLVMLFAGLDYLLDDATRYAHIREALIRYDAHVPRGLPPPYSQGTQVGSTFS